MEKLLEIINDEDEKNPLTDEEIAAMLNVTRYDVIRMRRKLEIEDYSKRRYPYLYSSIESILKINRFISTADLHRALVEDNYNVSKFLVSGIKEIILKQMSGIEQKPEFNVPPKPVYEIRNSQKYTPYLFDMIVGAEGSIATQIKQAIAAAIYPPAGVHTLIVGETGTGKSLLAETMFRISKESGIIKQEGELVRLNCADYANNQELLCSQLFGHCKGAFTGAESNKDGLIKKANGGILFLDEIHRLPPEGQEILFSVIDNGTYRKLGQAENEESVSVMIIGATTEPLNSSLLLTFTRRMPMVIELPALMKRTVEERYEMIIKFLQNEANKTIKDIHINSESLCGLLLYECRGNIGQLKSDIKVACARSYLKNIENNQDMIKLDITDFNSYIQDELLRKRYSKEGLEKYCDHGIIFKPDIEEITYYDEKQVELAPQNVYEFISNKYEMLRAQDIPFHLIQEILAKEVDYRVNKMVRDYNRSNLREQGGILNFKDELVEKAIIHMINLAEEQIGKLNDGVLYCLKLHLSESIDRIRKNAKFPVFEAENIRTNNFFEYEIASDMLAYGGRELNIQFPKEEMAYVSMYLKTNGELTEKRTGKVKILIVTHGNVALEISKLVNEIIGSEATEYICIPLDEKNDKVIEKVLRKARETQENGILLLVDMGSSIALGEIITRETGKKTKTVSRVEVAMALDTAMKVRNEDISLEEIYDYVKSKPAFDGRTMGKKQETRGKAIITLCITGQGAAMGIKDLLNSEIPEIREQSILVIPIGLINDNTDQYIEEIKAENELIAIVGTFNPNIDDVPFYPIEAFVENRFGLLRTLIQSKKSVLEPHKKRELILREDLILCRSDFQTKEQAMDYLVTLLEKQGDVTVDFRENILSRERLIDTGFVNGIAIPHTYARYVNRSAVAIAVLERPVYWAEGYDADIIVMLALKSEDSYVLKRLHKWAHDLVFLSQLRDCRSVSEIFVLLNPKFME